MPSRIQTWAHRGASADFPENTMASFSLAIRQGATGLESDVHLTADGRIVMFHDPRLDRTTDGHGLISERCWDGPDGLKHVRTKQAPVQPIPLFSEVLDLLMLPENQHVKFNIDVKTTSDPHRIFPIMAQLIEKHPSIKSRLVLGIWHPSFLLPSLAYLPKPVQRFHIGMSTSTATRFFWPYVDGFSLVFDCLVDREGTAFRRRCKEEGKALGVWTVNDETEFLMSLDWQLDAILTDKPALCLDVQAAYSQDRLKAFRDKGLNSWLFAWSKTKYYGFAHREAARQEMLELVRDGGEFDQVDLPLDADALRIAIDKLLAAAKAQQQQQVTEPTQGAAEELAGLPPSETVSTISVRAS